MMQRAISCDGAKLTLFMDAPDWPEVGRAMAIGKCTFESAKAGVALIAQACDIARAEGAKGLIGPMDGDTWHSYRLVSQTDGTPPFLMEPPGDAVQAQAFTQAGFEAISHYASARVPLEQVPDTLPAPPDGMQLTQWDGTDPEALFAQVHAVSKQAFSKNPFYKDITREDFLAMYMPMVPLLKPELIWFARDSSDGLVGFLFGIPNYAEGPQSQTAILKTYASLAKGAGYALSQRFYHAAKALGHTTAIHALMHDDNLSADRSDTNGADIFRRYALYGKRLA